ncbi:MAG: L7Ae/L30e/S12e/Gadd45 family ribosomal protein [Bacillota bacterium]|uniref:50S ribosomal protein L7Ae-like protein n=1 Tax=Thermanaerosceptrum fracticalcis TaxID=1712410 RepID=A0A7G6E5T4_THEFR|nr:ribosomal L7Ae/L30e/S12e/Gadd45 family protein [Thermanaerosceptrum fracticalcis]QNB47438.1 50S ribosomal protein L7Ae-like protein [Thermanaerosceptrum fracticalcis]
MQRLVNAKRKTVGMKQTTKALERGQARIVFLAKDADEKVRRPVMEMCRVHGVPLEEVETMRELGKAGGIQVPAAVAAIIE